MVQIIKDCTGKYKGIFLSADNLIDDGRIEEAKTVLKESYQKNPDELNDFYDVFIKEKQVGFEAVKAEYEALAKAKKIAGEFYFPFASIFIQ